MHPESELAQARREIRVRVDRVARPASRYPPHLRSRRGSRHPASPSAALLVHEPDAEHAIGLELVVRATAKPNPLDGCQPAARNRFNVIELEKDTRVAPVPIVADE